MIAPGFLAGTGTVNAENAIRALIPSGSSVVQALVYFGALFLVGLAVFAWAVFFRTPHRRRHSHHHRPKPAPKHHRQGGPLPRNPTLAEAGGLPPVRSEKPPPPPA
jgi:hypothetical protein